MVSADHAAKPLTRRRLITLAAIGGAAAAAVLAGCGETQIVTETKIQTVEVEKSVEKIVTVEVVKEVPVEKIVTQIVEKTVEKIVTQIVEKTVQKFKIQYGLLQSEQSPEIWRYHEFKRLVEANSKGNIEVTLFPSGQLGDERLLTEQVKFGAIEMMSGGGSIQAFAPEVGLFYLPFLYPTDECFFAAWDITTSSVAQKVAGIVLEKTKTIRPLAFYMFGGTRNVITKTKPIETLEDFKGMKIRVDTAPTSTATMNLLGAAPVVVPFTEVYNALQTGVVEAAENILPTFLAFKWIEVAKHVTLTGHNHVLHVVQMHEPFFQSLPEEYRKIVTDAALAPVKEGFARDLEVLKTVRGDLEKAGIKIYELKDKAKWVAAASPLQDKWATDNKFTAELAEIRKICA